MSEKGIYSYNIWRYILLAIITIGGNYICDKYYNDNIGVIFGITLLFILFIIILGFGSHFFDSLKINKKAIIYFWEFILKFIIVSIILLIVLKETGYNYGEFNTITIEETLRCFVLALKEEVFTTYATIIIVMYILSIINKIKNKEMVNLVVICVCYGFFQLKMIISYILQNTEGKISVYQFGDGIVTRIMYALIGGLVMKSTYMVTKSLGVTTLIHFGYRIIVRNLQPLIMVIVGRNNQLNWYYKICIGAFIIMDGIYILGNLCKVDSVNNMKKKSVLKNVNGKSIYDYSIWKYIFLTISLVIFIYLFGFNYYDKINWTIYTTIMFISCIFILGFGKDFMQSLKMKKKDIKYFIPVMLELSVIVFLLVVVLNKVNNNYYDYNMLDVIEVFRCFIISFREELFMTYGFILIAMYLIRKCNTTRHQIMVLIIANLCFGLMHLENIFYILNKYELGAISYNSIAETIWGQVKFALIGGLIIKGTYMVSESLTVPIIIHFLMNIIDRDLSKSLIKMTDNILNLKVYYNSWRNIQELMHILFAVWIIYILWKRKKEDTIEKYKEKRIINEREGDI